MFFSQNVSADKVETKREINIHDQISQKTQSLFYVCQICLSC